MWKAGISLFAVIFFFLYLTAVSIADAVIQEMVWKNVSSNIKESDLQAVAVSPDNGDVVYTNSSGAIYRTLDGGKNWQEILSFRGTGNAINSIAVNPVNTKIIYTGTENGLYKSNDQGTSWQKIFTGIGNLEDSVISIAINPINPEIIFVGTKAGLFSTENSGTEWKRAQSLHSGANVSFITIDPSKPDIIYAATERGLYRSIDSGAAWKRIFETNSSMDEIEVEYSAGEVEIEGTNGTEINITSIAIDPANTETIYIGTSEGIFVTEDAGTNWKPVSSAGLLSNNVRHILILPKDTNHIYTATSRGIFRYSKNSKRWAELYKGLATIDISFLSFDQTTQDKALTLWAVTKRGVFKTISPAQSAVSKNEKIETDEMFSVFAHEPSITEIQKTAIRYAEVHPEKIEEWRKAASSKAWLPDLTVGYDRDRDWQNSTYFYSTATEKYKADDITRGKDSGWSVSVTWELGDLIWNDDQTSIDTRSRLMVQLRDDVLNEVTRLYFERRRLQLELFLSPPKEIKEQIEKELRLQELTADIDALTGFYLSKRLGQIRD